MGQPRRFSEYISPGLSPLLMKHLVPINWSLLRDRIIHCKACGLYLEARLWRQDAFPFPALTCPRCFDEFDMTGAVHDYYREPIDR